MSENSNIMSNYDNQGDENGISFYEILFLLKKYFFITFFILSISLIASVLYLAGQKPVFISKGIIMVDDLYVDKMNMTSISNYNDLNSLSNEIEIIKSRKLSENTIIKLLNSDHRNNLSIFGTRKVEYSNFGKIFGFLNSDQDSKDLEIEISQKQINNFAKNFRSKIKVKQIRNTKMLEISITSNHPEDAALLVNTLIESYSELDLAWSRGEMSNLENFLKKQIDKKEKQLIKSEEELKIFQEKEKIFGLGDKSSILLNNLMSAESKYFQNISQSNIINERKKFIMNKLTEEEKKLAQNVSNSINERLYALKNEIAIKEAELVSAISQQGSKHQIVEILQQKLKGLKNNLENETKSLISQGISITDPLKYRQELMDSVINFNAALAMSETKSNEFKKLVDKYQDQLGTLPEKVLDFTRLARNIKIYSETYSLMRQKLEEVLINDAAEVGRIRILDSARPNYQRIAPNNTIGITFGLILGLGLSAFVIFIREFFDKTVKSINDLQKRNLTILALIPTIGNKSSKQSKRYQRIGSAEKIQRRLITHEDPKSPVSESYRSLRTSLLYTSNIKKSNVMLISSPGPGEGKTTTIVNLAITYANLGLKTILLDTDLRKPVVHKVFSLNREPGITKIITEKKENYSKIIQSTSINNLSVITAGVVPPNPSEILASDKMNKFISNLREDYDLILMDAPPLLAVTDAFVCMQYQDQFILVVRSAVTEKIGLDRALAQLKQMNANFSGVVVNDINTSNSYYAGYYYNYYDEYYGSD